MADDEEVEEEEEKGKEEVVADVVPEALLAPSKYEVRPMLGDKFQAQNVREIIMQVMTEQLAGKQYKLELAPRLVKTIANSVREAVQELDMKRYKIVVSTTLIEMKGAGVKCGQRVIWDPETDDYADNVFRNDSLYCYTICYGVYMY